MEYPRRSKRARISPTRPRTTASALHKIKVRSTAIAEGLYVDRHDAPLLDAARVRAALVGTAFEDVRPLARTASTNDDAVALLGDPNAAGATLVAEFQTAGKGRKPGRAWIAPAGGALPFTTILPRSAATAAL